MKRMDMFNTTGCCQPENLIPTGETGWMADAEESSIWNGENRFEAEFEEYECIVCGKIWYRLEGQPGFFTWEDE